jgi:hypothetical protein|tara:strand:+ start:177 stop:920 length:744 start_codon:yes stop_codon:yes gene_type:complete
MNDKIIEFLAHEEYVDLKEDYPTPIKLNIPEWYKKLEHTLHNKTVKGCMPFLDTLTTGYLLRVPQDYTFKHNVDNDKGEKDSFFEQPPVDDQLLMAKSINLGKSMPDLHHRDQLKGSPLVGKNNNQNILKILNPWKIITPPGYSCLFLPPLNNTDDRFSIIPGIVDTDAFPNEINFPIIINGDKYKTLDTTIKKGTPYVQIIPFKRDPWKMKIKGVTTKYLNKGKIFYFLKLIHIYKTKFWSKKKWN